MRHRFRIAGGFALLVAGGVLALPGVPGPGILLVLLGLVLLADHFTWARKALDWIKRWKKPGAGQEAGS